MSNYCQNCYELAEENKKLKEKNKLLEKISTHLTDNSLFSVRHFKKENAKLKEKLETLQDEIGHLQQVLLQIKDIAMCGDCEHDCDNCMQGQIHQIVDKAVNDEGKD